MTKHETDTIMGPMHFASAAINGDHSGFDDEDEQSYAEWRAFNIPDGWDIVDVADDSSFSWNCRLHGLPWAGGELVEYTIMKIQP